MEGYTNIEGLNQLETEAQKKAQDAIITMDNFIETLNLDYDAFTKLHEIICDALNAVSTLEREETEKDMVNRLADKLLSCAKNDSPIP